jgi:hypothetical protein
MVGLSHVSPLRQAGGERRFEAGGQRDKRRRGKETGGWEPRMERGAWSWELEGEITIRAGVRRGGRRQCERRGCGMKAEAGT